MNVGKTLFAQIMDFLPWSTFARIVVRYDGDRRVRTLSCAEQYRAMAFTQLTYRESLRDIETCLSAQAASRAHVLQPSRRSQRGKAGARSRGCQEGSRGHRWVSPRPVQGGLRAGDSRLAQGD